MRLSRNFLNVSCLAQFFLAAYIVVIFDAVPAMSAPIPISDMDQAACEGTWMDRVPLLNRFADIFLDNTYKAKCLDAKYHPSINLLDLPIFKTSENTNLEEDFEYLIILGFYTSILLAMIFVLTFKLFQERRKYRQLNTTPTHHEKENKPPSQQPEVLSPNPLKTEEIGLKTDIEKMTKQLKQLITHDDEDEEKVKNSKENNQAKISDDSDDDEDEENFKNSKKNRERKISDDPSAYIANLKQEANDILLNMMKDDILITLQHLQNVCIAKYSPDLNVIDGYKKFNEIERKIFS